MHFLTDFSSASLVVLHVRGGMQAPEIRHSAACKRKRLEFDRIQEAEATAGESPPAMEEIPASPAPLAFPTTVGCERQKKRT